MVACFTENFIKSDQLALLLKPTNSTFDDFNLGDDLHIGIYDGKFHVCSFSAEGIAFDPVENWINSLIVYSFSNTITDQNLINFCFHKKKLYSNQSYNEIQQNCFDFVLDFLTTVTTNFVTNKKKFVEKFIKYPLARLIYDRESSVIQYFDE
uniref:MKRN2 opposite strand protein-like C-terminal domain-containing protein n=1 Tax=Panagrolaimus superbus TaxID=310955 RepID=A0A914XZH6_9BILA